MKKLHCHRCGNESFLVLTENDNIPCPCCSCQYGGIVLTVPTITPERLVIADSIDIFQPLDLITTQLIAFFLGHGMTVTNCARQMGITRATIYARLKKHNLLQFKKTKPPTLSFNDSDLSMAGLRLTALPKGK